MAELQVRAMGRIESERLRKGGVCAATARRVQRCDRIVVPNSVVQRTANPLDVQRHPPPDLSQILEWGLSKGKM